MENLLIYGASESGQKIYNEYMSYPNNKQYNVLAFVDSNPLLHGKLVCEKTVIPPAKIQNYEYTQIIIASLTGEKEIYTMLTEEYGIEKEKISTADIDYFFKIRELFCQYNAAIINAKGLQGSVAEVGVWRGDFAKYINAYFPERTLYLFDTFTGLDKRDIQTEHQNNIKSTFYINQPDVYANTSIDTVKAALPHPEQAVFKAGFFPETATGITEKFVFVSLDVNLYAPTLAGLEFFYPKMVSGGIIVCHDYFSWEVEPGAHIAIQEFCLKHGLHYFAIGDRMSVAIFKQ